MAIRVSPKYVISDYIGANECDWCKIDDVTGTMVFGTEYPDREYETTLEIGRLYTNYWQKVYEELEQIKEQNREYYNEIIRMMIDQKWHLRFIENTPLWKQVERDYNILRAKEEFK